MNQILAVENDQKNNKKKKKNTTADIKNVITVFCVITILFGIAITGQGVYAIVNKRIAELLEEIQKNMFKMAEENIEKKTTVAKTLEEFEKNINENQGYVKTMWCGSSECEEKIHELTGAKSRCIPFNQEHISDTCVCCGKPASKMVVWGRQY